MRAGSGTCISSGRAGTRGRTLVLAVLCFLLPDLGTAADVRVFTVADGLPSNWVTALAGTPDGKVWVGTGNAGVFLYDPRTGTRKGYRAADGLSSDEVKSVALFGGKVYVGTSSGLSVYDGNSWVTIGKVENVTMRNVVLSASPDGKELWACSVYLAGGTVRFDGKNWEFMGGKGRGLFNDVQGFAFLPEGVLLGDGSGIPYVHEGQEVTPLGEGLPPGSIFSAGVRSGNWLIGTTQGLFEYRKGWKKISLPAEIAGSPVFSIASRGDRIAVGTGAGLALLAGGEQKNLTAGTGLPASRITAVAFVDDVVAAGTAKGLALVTKW